MFARNPHERSEIGDVRSRMWLAHAGYLLPQPPNVIRSLRVTVALPVRLTGPPL